MSLNKFSFSPDFAEWRRRRQQQKIRPHENIVKSADRICKKAEETFEVRDEQEKSNWKTFRFSLVKNHPLPMKNFHFFACHEEVLLSGEEEES